MKKGRRCIHCNGIRRPRLLRVKGGQSIWRTMCWCGTRDYYARQRGVPEQVIARTGPFWQGQK